jgi:peptidoglycan hydrolase CwlO-like protein
MTLNEFFVKVKENSSIIYVVLGVIVIGVILMLVLNLKACNKPPITPTDVINTAQQQMEAQFQAQIKDKDTQIKDYKSRLVVSEGKYKVLVKKYNDLQREIDNVRPPQTNEELRSRFTALGYPPLPVK